MKKELELWRFAASHLKGGEDVVLLIVAESSGSSPGRAGYKMAVAADGELCGSIGGGVMEVNLVEHSRKLLSEPGAVATGFRPATSINQEHRKNAEHPSGMICSGRQTIILQQLGSGELPSVELVIADLIAGNRPRLVISEIELKTAPDGTEPPNCPLPNFERIEDAFTYIDKLGPKNFLYIIGGGHCALALSDLMSKLDFHVVIFDDRSDLNTIEKNEFADRVEIIDSYENIAKHVPRGDDIYVVVMTVGYQSDAVVIKQLIDHEIKYFGVLGSKAKMATLLKELRDEGIDAEKLARIRTPIGLPINSRTPEEIAVSIAAEIIAVKNL